VSTFSSENEGEQRKEVQIKIKEKKTRKKEEEAAAAPFLSVLHKEKNHLSAISYFKIDGIFDTQAIKSITFHEMLR